MRSRILIVCAEDEEEHTVPGPHSIFHFSTLLGAFLAGYSVFFEGVFFEDSIQPRTIEPVVSEER